MKPIVCIIASVTAGVMLFAATVMAQRAGRPHTRYHTATERAEVTLKPANETLGSRQDSIDVSGTTRTITSNGIPSHPVGAFPNSGNPHTITPQDYVFTVTTKPARTGVATAAKRWLLGRGRQRRSVRGGYRGILARRAPRRLELRRPWRRGPAGAGCEPCPRSARWGLPLSRTAYRPDAAAWLDRGFSFAPDRLGGGRLSGLCDHG